MGAGVGLTDLALARAIARPLTASLRDAYAPTDPKAPLTQLRWILARNQNEPPAGNADGSFTETQWTALRDLCQAMDDAARAAGRLLA